MIDVWNLMLYLRMWEKRTGLRVDSQGERSYIYVRLVGDLINASAFVIEAHIDDVVPRLGSLSSDVFIESVGGYRL
jgi:hypothetical protein